MIFTPAWPYTRTWPYGTVKPGAIVFVTTKGTASAAVFVADGEAESPYILLWQRELARTRKGQRGTITFTDGGQSGGYWHWAPEESGR